MPERVLLLIGSTRVPCWMLLRNVGFERTVFALALHTASANLHGPSKGHGAQGTRVPRAYIATLDASHASLRSSRPRRLSSPAQPIPGATWPMPSAPCKDLQRHNFDQLTEATEIASIEGEQYANTVNQHSRDKIGVMHLLARPWMGRQDP